MKSEVYGFFSFLTFQYYKDGIVILQIICEHPFNLSFLFPFKYRNLYLSVSLFHPTYTYIRQYKRNNESFTSVIEGVRNLPAMHGYVITTMQ